MAVTPSNKIYAHYFETENLGLYQVGVFRSATSFVVEYVHKMTHELFLPFKSMESKLD